MYPETGYREFNTSKLIAEKLDQLDIEYTSGIAKTGIVAEINKGEGKCIVLRADMDALPITEETGLKFASKNKGVMHACGHDIHTTILLGTISELSGHDFKGKIKFAFQPSEEGTDDDEDNKSGGQRMVEEGVLRDADYALALHVHPQLAVGKLYYTNGTAMAYTNTFEITVLGKAGHAGAAPHLGTDAVLIAANLIQDLHTIVSRDLDPIKTGVVSITVINGGTKSNIIADKVVMKGTVRALNTEEYSRIMARMKQIIAGTEVSFNTKIDLRIGSYYPALENDITVHEKIEGVARDIFDQGVEETGPMLGGEDFAFFSKEVPAMFYFIGAKDIHDPTYFLHHPRVIFNEDCIKYGIDFLTRSVLKLLSS
jgi:amidohydrolase